MKPPKVVPIDVNASEATLSQLAEECGTSPARLRRIFEFVESIESRAIQDDLSPEELTNALVTVLVNAISCAPTAKKQADALTTIFHSMWTHLRLPVQ
jgi:hypothetical protein|tara:strand:- start:154 stop:447 length:294 start_codon:yes stop_codon:yes gene_type:complete